MNDATFQKKLMSVLTDNKYDRFIGGKRSGKLDTKRLFKISNSDRIFKKKQERQGKHYSVSLLVDCSGSMCSGNRIEKACELAKSLTVHFQKAGVDLEVIGFNTFEHTIKSYGNTRIDSKFLDEMQRKMYEYAHHSGSYYEEDMYFFTELRMAVPKSDKELVNKLKKKDYPVEDHSAQGNCDGEIVYFARQRLAKRKGGKIILVLSDGRPRFDAGMDWWSYQNPKVKYQDYSLKEEVQKAIHDGITFVSVGIQTDAVFEYYPEENCATVNNVNELYTTVVNKLQKHIKRG